MALHEHEFSIEIPLLLNITYIYSEACLSSVSSLLFLMHA